ncbi:MAG: hypothetical protein IT301_09855 [Dehalococcoidia bacterium]|nr:hypothetical protein [Dehalococcoidia bacterium]
MKIRKHWFTTAALIGSCAALALLAACGGGGGKKETIDTSNVAIDARTTTSNQVVPEQVIEVKAGSFEPAAVTIKAGTKVIWKWTASTPCSLQMAGSTIPEQSSGTFERVFSSAGSTFSYQCAGKPDMVGKITVE